jgi:predicted nucleotidyltransferase
MKFGLTDTHIHTIRHILSQYPEITHATLFGSRALGNFREGSDIDLALWGSAPPRLAQLAHELDDSNLPYKVDCIWFEDITHEALKEHIQRVGIPFYSTFV